MTRVGGGAFDLVSADIAQDNSTQAPGTGVIVTGFFGGGGSIRATVALPPIPNQGFQHATFVGYRDLASVTFRGAGNLSGATTANGFTLDNVGIRTNAVPEPSSVLALGMGVLVLLGCGQRRKSGAAKRMAD